VLSSSDSAGGGGGGGGAGGAPGAARLRLIRGDGADGFTFELNATEHPAGRETGPILFPDDPTVSPLHATFLYRDGRLFVRDEESRNGTFIRIYDPVPLHDDEIFLCGEQVMRFEAYRPPRPSPIDDGATFGGTPLGPWEFRLVQTLPGNRTGRAFCAMKPTVTIGREDCDMNFFHDRFISRYHSRVEQRADGEYQLTDLDSRNGTYVRVRGELPLSDGDYIFIGRQLLRVEM
jgi:pSer/pThr/pTyr-binding forkhead associated (FHA) protein